MNETIKTLVKDNLTEAEQDDWDERSAIMEEGGKVGRDVAELRAYRAVLDQRKLRSGGR